MPRDYDGDGDDDDEDERIRFLDGSNNSNSHGRAAVESSSSEQQSPNKRSQVKRSASSSSSSSYQSKRKWFLTAATLFAVLLIAKYVFVTTNHSSDAVDSMHVQEKIPGVEYFDDAWVPTATAEHGTKPAPPDPTVGAVPSGGGVPVVETETKSADVGKEDDANVKPVVVTTPTVQTPPPSPTDVVVTTAATQPDADAPTSIISNNINENLKPGYKKAAQEVSDTYLRRGKFLTDETRRALADVWGAWTFADPTKTSGKTSIFPPLPTGDYPNGDIPREAFPANAWQTDPEYLAQWLPEAIALAERAMEAILGEYGNSKYDKPSASFEERAIMFNLTTVKAGYNFKHPPGNAGYASLATLQAIRKRVLHAVLTEDAFIFVMGGHSAAAGHGNHFQQSYTLQVQRVLEPVLARLGVFHKAHNYGFGGLGTMQNGMASRDLYGPRIDVLMWDSGMTEGEAPVKDIFARAGFLAGDKVPVLWGEPDSGQYDGKAPGAGSIVTGFGGKCFVL